MLPRGRTGGLIVLIAPPRRAGLENLARALSIAWARHRIRPGTEAATAELVAFLASKAGAYHRGCAFTLR